MLTQDTLASMEISYVEALLDAEDRPKMKSLIPPTTLGVELKISFLDYQRNMETDSTIHKSMIE